jgi:hypothetical protein
MRHRNALLVASTVALACSAAPAGARPVAAVQPCKLMQAAIGSEPLWKLRLTKHVFATAGPHAFTCSWTSPGFKYAYNLALNVTVNRSASLAHSQLGLLAGKGRPLRGTPADEAWVYEQHPSGQSVTRIVWRKGRYAGALSIGGVGRAGDLEDATGIFAPFVRKIPRT